MKPISEYFADFWKNQLHYTSKEVLNSLEWDDFIRIVSIMNIKSCGTKIERRILEKNKWIKIEGHARHGDGKTPDGKIVEIKSSIISPIPGSTITFRGIRPWHIVDDYYFILVDLSKFHEPPKTTIFKLSQDQISMERDTHKTLRPYNMKKNDRTLTQNFELGTSFKNGDLERWIKEYNYTDFLLR